jgi:hypothetical protein
MLRQTTTKLQLKVQPRSNPAGPLANDHRAESSADPRRASISASGVDSMMLVTAVPWREKVGAIARPCPNVQPHQQREYRPEVSRISEGG